ncbi:MAG: hypothetical protein AMXMBFR13_44720 [Phycisphaerae bacterium]
MLPLERGRILGRSERWAYLFSRVAQRMEPVFRARVRPNRVGIIRQEAADYNLLQVVAVRGCVSRKAGETACRCGDRVERLSPGVLYETRGGAETARVPRGDGMARRGDLRYL